MHFQKYPKMGRFGFQNPPKVMIHQGPSRVCKMFCLQLWVPIVGEPSLTLGVDLWNVRFLWEIEKHDQIDHRNEVTADGSLG